MMGPYLPECSFCAGLGQYDTKLHCVHFTDKVIHWHEVPDGGRQCVCGPEDGVVINRGGPTLHLESAAYFDSLTDAREEFTRRAEALRLGRSDAEDDRH